MATLFQVTNIAGKMWRRLCIVMEIFLLQAIQCGNGHGVYYRRKAELGYFAVDLLVVTKPSRIQCASACSLTVGCSVISYSRNQTLCKLSRGIGEYVSDPAWTTMILPAREQRLDGQVGAPFTTSNVDITVTSYPTSTIKETPDYLIITETTTEEVTSQPADLATTITSNTQFSAFTSVLALSSNPSGTTVRNGVECPEEFQATPSGSCFFVAPSFRTLDKATSSCSKHHGYLATITSVVENQELIAIFEALDTLTTHVRIGGTDSEIEGTWKWVTGEPFSWIGTGPDNPDPGADCLAYSFSNSWKWINVLCTDAIHSVCEIDPI